jgi:hypothetical protein
MDMHCAGGDGLRLAISIGISSAVEEDEMRSWPTVAVNEANLGWKRRLAAVVKLDIVCRLRSQ